MSDNPGPAWSNRRVLSLGLVLFAACALFHLGMAAMGRSFYRDSHLGAALEYSKTGINLLRPVIIGFNATQTPTPQELPLWQAAAAIAFKICGPWFGWANLVSLLLFGSCLFPLYQVARNFYGDRCACWTVVLFLAQPLVFLYAGVAGTEGLSIATAVWFIYFATRLLDRPSLAWWGAACIAGILAALSKLPFFLASGIAIFLLTVLQHRNSLSAWLYMAALAAVIGVAFVAWTHYTDRCLAGAEFNFVDLRSSTQEMSFWYFGDLKYRLSPGNWVKGAWRFINACFGNAALFAPFLAGLLLLRNHLLAKLWFLGGALTTLVFTQLVLHHWHYYLMFSPAIALIAAEAAVAWEAGFIPGAPRKSCLAFGILALVLLLSIAQGMVEMKAFLFPDPYNNKIAAIIKDHTTPEDKLLIQGGGWGGNILILADRRGLSIWDTKFLENADNYHRLKELGYTKLVMISESPLQNAVESANPAAGTVPRMSYREALTATAQNWPTLYQTDDLLIKSLP